MIVSGDRANLRQYMALDDEAVRGNLSKWAASYIIAEEAIGHAHALDEFPDRVTSLQDTRYASTYDQAVGLFQEAQLKVGRAATLARGVTENKARYLDLSIRNVLAQERADLQPTDPDWRWNHFSRLALTSTLEAMKPTVTKDGFFTPEMVALRYRKDALNTLAGLSLLDGVLQKDEDTLVVNFNGRGSAQAIAGKPHGSGLPNINIAKTNVTVPMENGSGLIDATVSVGRPVVIRKTQSQQDRLTIPVQNLAPVVLIDVEEINSEGLYGDGDFELSRSLQPKTVIVTGLARELLQPRFKTMFERRYAVAAIGRVAQEQMDF